MLEIYLTDLQAYNEGYLVGKWITLPLSEFELSQVVSEVLIEGEGPDHQGLWQGYTPNYLKVAVANIKASTLSNRILPVRLQQVEQDQLLGELIES